MLGSWSWLVDSRDESWAAAANANAINVATERASTRMGSNSSRPQRQNLALSCGNGGRRVSKTGHYRKKITVVRRQKPMAHEEVDEHQVAVVFELGSVA